MFSVNCTKFQSSASLTVMIHHVDYDRKAEDAVDYEDIDEEYDKDYDESEVQVVSEEDYVLPKREYFLAAVALSSLNSKASVFDDDDYDEEEEQEEEHSPVEKSFDSEERGSGLLLKSPFPEQNA